MADERDYNPATDAMINAAERGNEFDVQRINSLIRQMTKAQEDTAQKTKNMDEEISSIAKKQKAAMKALGRTDIETTSPEMMREMKGVIGS
jgi:ABC-type transporter MlaC component